MSYFVQPKIETCYSCHKGQARPRIVTSRTNNEIITEAKWVCPNCGNQFKHGIISKQPINTSEK